MIPVEIRREMPCWRALYMDCLQKKIWCIRMGKPVLYIRKMIWWQWLPQTKTVMRLSWHVRKRRGSFITIEPVR